MARWGTRASLGVSITAALMLLASVLATGASASEPETTTPVEVEAEFVGDGGKLWVQVTGCEPGSLVRIALIVPSQEKVGEDAVLAATLKVDDFPVPEKGPFSTYIDLGEGETPAEIKVYCWSGGYGEKPIDDIKDPGKPDDGEDIPVKDPVDEGDDGDEVVGKYDDCIFLQGDDLPSSVSGNMFIADQDYRLVVLFWNTELWPRDEVYDVETGDKLTTTTGDKILKIGLCGGLGKPGYTPDVLDVFAQKSKDLTQLKLIVSGCPTGDLLTVYYIGDVYGEPEELWSDFLLVTANDEWSGLLGIRDGWYPDSVRVECSNGAEGAAGVLLPDDYEPYEEAVEKKGEVVQIVRQETIQGDRVQISGAVISRGSGGDDGDSTGAAPVTYEVTAIEPIASDDVATGAVLDRAVERIEGNGGVYVAATEGLTADAVQAVAASPSQQLDLGGFFADVTGSVGIDAESSANALQLALGVLAIAGLAAFVAMRRVTRVDTVSII